MFHSVVWLHSYYTLSARDVQCAKNCPRILDHYDIARHDREYNRFENFDGKKFWSLAQPTSPARPVSMPEGALSGALLRQNRGLKRGPKTTSITGPLRGRVIVELRAPMFWPFILVHDACVSPIPNQNNCFMKHSCYTTIQT